MASSKVMASTSPSNPDLPRHQSSSSSLHLLPHQTPTPFSSMNMDDLLKNIYSDSDHFPANHVAVSDPKKSVDDVWKEIVNQPVGGTSAQPAMTLEDFLTKAGAVREEDVKGVEESGGVFGGDGGGVMSGVIAYPVAANQVFGNGGVARGKRRAVEEAPVDKATQQKQRRMIKNRESAARSRERKQAYTVELESLVTHLEEENARLMQEEAEQTRERFKQLMENLIPVVEKKRPPRVLRRVHSL
ncbi:G-box-binding factor 4 [Heracleum sosnowskyi]|uniref:G-box-binding factor 4 n=1 Tax=Heracleum sosnowskyi TaxID=360622 RepID=A0AAD8H453_9APIA|nr:G-box-binding factor 4 [Heracleum sosnowskyi]